MFIRKRDYIEICERLANIENALPAFREATDEKLFAMSESVTELTDNLGELKEKVKAFEEEAEAVSEDRKIEKAFIDGFSNIMNYEVGNGRRKTQ